MNRNRVLIPVVLGVIMLAGWYKLLDGAHGKQAQYDAYLSQARSLGENGAVQRAVEQYNAALEVKSSPELYAEVAQLYKERGQSRKYLSWCEDFINAYPTSPLAYDCMLEAYLGAEDYESCFDLLETAEKRAVSSQFIEQTRGQIAYAYQIEYNTYQNVGVYSNSYCAVEGENGWGFVNRYGEVKIALRYQTVGPYTQSGLSPVARGGSAYYIDKNGVRDVSPGVTYEELGIIVNDRAAVRRSDGKYIYLDAGNGFEPLEGEYLDASAFNYGLAAVRDEQGWHLIDVNGDRASSAAFSDVILDEKRIAVRNDRLFAATSGAGYAMLDANGGQIGGNRYEDARLFLTDEPTAVKTGGRWRFVDRDGNFISEKTYEDARPFSNGLAAVRLNGSWCFVDENENVCIEGPFLDAKDFNEKGSCFVKIGDSWQLLKLFRLNRK